MNKFKKLLIDIKMEAFIILCIVRIAFSKDKEYRKKKP